MRAHSRQEVLAEAATAGERLDRVLTAALPGISRARVQALLRSGHITAESGAPLSPGHRVRTGERFLVELPPPAAAEPQAQEIPLAVVYEDEDLVVVDKPAGMTVHPAPGSPDATLVNALIAHCGGTLSGIGGVRRPGIVHRIDKDTTGLIVAAKNDAAHADLARQFAARSVERSYRAVVWGVPQPASGRIEGNIGRSARDRTRMALLRGGGRPAATRYRVIRPFDRLAAEIECRLETGRTHQVRVHLASRGHPLIGDRTYGRGRTAAALPGGFARQALHAETLGFRHPRSGAALRFRAELPVDMRDLMSRLEGATQH